MPVLCVSTSATICCQLAYLTGLPGDAAETVVGAFVTVKFEVAEDARKLASPEYFEERLYVPAATGVKLLSSGGHEAVLSLLTGLDPSVVLPFRNVTAPVATPCVFAASAVPV